MLQQRLYLGVYPMAPIPASDHAISDQCGGCQAYYENYGAMFASMQGKRWFLAPHAVQVVTPPGAKANAFTKQDGTHLYAVVMVNGSTAVVKVEGIVNPIAGFEALHVGAVTWAKVPHHQEGPGAFTVTVSFTGKRSSDAAVVRAVAAAA